MTNNIQEVKDKSIIKSGFIGVITSFVITLILIMILSFFLVNTNISENIIGPGIVVITCISIFVGTMTTAKKNGLLYGSAIGIIYIAFLYILSSIFNGSFGITIGSAILILLSILSGMLGGIAGVNIKKK